MSVSIVLYRVAKAGKIDQLKELEKQMDRYVERQVGYRIINGFVPASEVAVRCDWLKSYHVDTYDGFSRLFDGLSVEVKRHLEGLGTPDKKWMFEKYVQPLVQFYLTALKEGNSIVICGE